LFVVYLFHSWRKRMKKVILAICVCAMAAPAINADPITIEMAASNFTATTADLTISYSGASGLPPYGISMVVDLTVDSAGAGSAEVVAESDVASGDSFFDVFIDLAADEPNNYLDPAKVDPCTGIWTGAGTPHPLAKTDAAGTPTFPVSVFSLCMGELAQTATIPASKDLAVITITRDDGVGAGTGCTVSIAADDLRGTIVDPNGDPLTVTYPADLPIVWGGAPQCFGGAGQQWTDWNALGNPTCWCDATTGVAGGAGRQCHGDAGNDVEVFLQNYRVFNSDLTLVIQNWQRKAGDPLLNPCADVDHKAEVFLQNYRVFNGDLTRVISNWQKKDDVIPANCPLTDAANDAYVPPI
jgi:hypothetical protein